MVYISVFGGLKIPAHLNYNYIYGIAVGPIGIPISIWIKPRTCVMQLIDQCVQYNVRCRYAQRVHTADCHVGHFTSNRTLLKTRYVKFWNWELMKNILCAINLFLFLIKRNIHRTKCFANNQPISCGITHKLKRKYMGKMFISQWFFVCSVLFCVIFNWCMDLFSHRIFNAIQL